jgi:tetratricopeptide (TPR) repeat protein
MRRIFKLLALCSLIHLQTVSADLFGKTPVSEAAKQLNARIIQTYKSQGIEPAIQLLDKEGRAFLNQSDATAQFDFFNFLQVESNTNGGIHHQEWCLALTHWNYQYCLKEGDSFWLSSWTPMMHEKYISAGKYGMARAVIDYERARLLESGKELEVNQMKTIRPANPEFPTIGFKTIGARERITAKEYAFFLSTAEQDLAEGRWQRAMEAAYLAANDSIGTEKWYQKNPQLTDSKVMISKSTSRLREAQYAISDGYRFLELREAELDALQELPKFNPAEEWGMNLVQFANCRVLHLEAILGSKGSEVIAEIEKISKEMCSNPNIPIDDAALLSLLMADVHFHTGNAEAGWKVINGLRAEKDITRDTRYEIDSEWCRHRVATGQTEGVESVLIDLLKIAREGGLKQREIKLYETYARLLVALGRFEDALFIQQELIRLLRSFDLTPRIPGALQQLAVIHALMGEKALADRNVKEASQLLADAKLPEVCKKRIRILLEKPLPSVIKPQEAQAGCDLQPMRSMMIPLEGLPSRGLFTLTNYSGKEQCGELLLAGEGLVFRDDATSSLIGVDVSSAKGNAEISRKVTIGAGDFLVIDLSRQMSPESKRATVAINWKPSEGEEQTAEWTGETVEKGVSLAVTDAGEYLDNPFYLVPIYHLLQYKDAFEQVADLRVIASKTTRIELYDQNDELVFVDADGDGAFTSEGDIVSKDLNRNGAGDLVLENSAKESRLRLFVRPKELIPGSELSLDVQLFKQGDWISYATDRILFPKNEK